MPVIECANCGFRGHVPTTFQGKLVKCAKCGQPFRVASGRGKVLRLLVWMLLFTGAGAGSYFGLMVLKERLAASADSAQASTEPAPPTGPARNPEDEEEAARQAAEAKRLAEEKKQQEAVLRKQEEEKQRQEAEAKRLEKERRDQEAREAKRKQEEEARLKAEQQQALKRNPKLSAALEDIEAAPDKYYGQFLIVDRVAVKVGAVGIHKDLDRCTLGVTSARGQYYSRVPLSGLLVSTGPKIGPELQRNLTASDDFYRFKLFAEVRRWERKSDPGRAHPEVFVYRLEIYSRAGGLTRALEE